FIATNRTLSKPRRIAGWLSMAVIFMMMAKTGSRGALIAFALVGLVLFWRSSVSYKVVIMVGAMALVMVAAMLLPKATKDRYFTFFEDDEPNETALESRVQASAVSSTWGRWGLLQDSITLTLLHPLFGVGAGQFVVAQDRYSWAVRQEKGSWHVTHNTFTEVSSENGIPALLFFVLALYFAFRGARPPEVLRARGQARPQYDEVNSISFCLRLSLLSYVISGMFGSFAYATQFPVLAGLVVAFARTAPFEAARRLVPEQRLPARILRPSWSVSARAKKIA
ncbi:MAG TPA: O-antigen ligase family protein, partial [Bryobacteraceae bacterium]